MTRRMIADRYRLALMTASSATFTAERERVRLLTDTPAEWRLCPSLTAFYDPAGMTQAEIDAYDAAQLAAHVDAAIDGQKALRALAEATFELKTTNWTRPQFLARIKAIYRTL